MNKKYQITFLKKCSKLLSIFAQNSMAVRLQKKIDLKLLYKTDKALWRVEQARKMGAIVGKNCRFYSLGFFSEPYLVEVGDNVIISGRVCMLTHDGGVYLAKDKIPDIRGHYGRIKIGNNCFLGMGAFILPNVEIGDNCIVGAGAVVMQSFPDNSVVMGNPAKVIFKTDMYIKMKTNSKYTLRHDTYPFPSRIPEDAKRKMLVEHFKDLPPPPPRRRKPRKKKTDD
jgi:acetyltransferase-like isoleucine patch superfamily enzyme